MDKIFHLYQTVQIKKNYVRTSLWWYSAKSFCSSSHWLIVVYMRHQQPLSSPYWHMYSSPFPLFSLYDHQKTRQIAPGQEDCMQEHVSESKSECNTTYLFIYRFGRIWLIDLRDPFGYTWHSTPHLPQMSLVLSFPMVPLIRFTSPWLKRNGSNFANIILKWNCIYKAI